MESEGFEQREHGARSWGSGKDRPSGGGPRATRRRFDQPGLCVIGAIGTRLRLPETRLRGKPSILRP